MGAPIISNLFFLPASVVGGFYITTYPPPNTIMGVFHVTVFGLCSRIAMAGTPHRHAVVDTLEKDSDALPLRCCV